MKFIRGVAGEICQRTGWCLLFPITYLLCNFLPVLFSMCMYLVITVFFTCILNYFTECKPAPFSDRSFVI